METQTMDNNDKFNLQVFLEAKNELRSEIETAFANLKTTKKFDRKDMIKVITKLHDLVRSNDQLSDLVMNDLMIIDNRFKQLEERLLMIGQSHTVLRQALEDKGSISKEDMQKVWDEKIKPQIEAKIKEAQAQTEGSSGLIDLNGNPIT